MRETLEWTKRSGPSAAAVIVVRERVRRAARRHRLQACDPDDLEQDVYLALLGVRAGDASQPPLLDGPQARRTSSDQLAAPPNGLARDVDRIVDLLLRPLGARPHSSRPLTAVVVSELPATPPSCGADARDLRLDVLAAIARLPGELRDACCRAVLDEMAAAGPKSSPPAENPFRVVAARADDLRPLFMSLDLHLSSEPDQRGDIPCT